MSDFLYILKCFVFTVLVALLMQLKVSGISIEVRTEQFLKNSHVTTYLQEAATGGGLMLHDAYIKIKSFTRDSVGSFRSPFESHNNKASKP